MKLEDAIKNRFSVRKYQDKPVEKEKLLKIVDLARQAPSAVNFQPWSFIIIESGEGRRKVQSCYDRTWFLSAPVYIIVCGNHNQSWKRTSDGKDHCDIDVAIAIDHLTLLAVSEGLGTCWVCNFDASRCKELFSLKKELEPIAIIPIGYPDQQMPERKRKTMNDIVIWEESLK